LLGGWIDFSEGNALPIAEGANIPGRAEGRGLVLIIDPFAKREG